MSGVSLFPPFFWQLLAVSFGAPLSTVNVHSAEELSWSFDASVFFFSNGLEGWVSSQRETWAFQRLNI